MKYGSENNSDIVQNKILGSVSVIEVKGAELFGAIIYQFGEWRIPTVPVESLVTKKEARAVSPRYHEWKTMHQSDKQQWYDRIEELRSEMTTGAQRVAI